MKPLRRRNPTQFYSPIFQMRSQQEYLFRIRILLSIFLTFCLLNSYFTKFFFFPGNYIFRFTDKSVLLFWAIILFLSCEKIFFLDVSLKKAVVSNSRRGKARLKSNIKRKWKLQEKGNERDSNRLEGRPHQGQRLGMGHLRRAVSSLRQGSTKQCFATV